MFQGIKTYLVLASGVWVALTKPTGNPCQIVSICDIGINKLITAMNNAFWMRL